MAGLNMYAETPGLSSLVMALIVIAMMIVFASVAWWYGRALRRLELEERLAGVTESLPGVFCARRLRPDDRAFMRFAMRAIEELYGVSSNVRAENASPILSNVHPDDLPALLDSVEESFRLSSPWQHRFRCRHPVKGERWIKGSAGLHPDPDGSVLWNAFFMDVTDHEEAKVAKREAERVARSVMDSLSYHIAVLDESGTILSVNDSWRTFAESNGAVGQVNEGANYLDICDLATGEGQELATAFAAGIREVLAGDRASFELEYACHSPSERRWFVNRVTPFRKGGPPRVVVSHQNITARKLAEERLRDRERMLAQSQKMAHVGSWEMDFADPSDLERNGLRWSDECYRIFGYEPGQVPVTSTFFFQAIHPEDREPIVTTFARMISERIPCEIEHRISRPDGAERVVHEWGQVAPDSNGHPSRVIGTCQDITERKRTEVALRSYAARLENLRGIDLAILEALVPRELAEAALRQLGRLVPSWIGCVLVLHPDQGEIEVVAVIGNSGAYHPLGTRFRPDRKVDPDIEELMAGRPVSIGDLQGVDLRSRPEMETLKADGLRSYIVVPMLDRGELVGMLFLGADCPRAYSAEHIDVSQEVADHLAIGLRQAFLFEENRWGKARLESLTRRLLQAEEEERRRIARELHDEIGQALTALKINLDVMVSGGEDDRTRLTESGVIVGQLLQQVRGMALDLRPPLLDDLGLAACLQWYVRRQAERTGLQGQFVADADRIKAVPEIGTACFRVAQEALTNVARHSGASRFSVELLQYSGGLQLVIRDDGVGFEPDAAMDAAVRGSSFGLVGMRERVELVGGKIAFVSGPGLGTEVQVDFPNSPIGPLGPSGSGPPILDFEKKG